MVRIPASAVLAALVPLGGCDEGSATGPEEPPEVVVEASPRRTDVDLDSYEAYMTGILFTGASGDGPIFLYKNGSIYKLDSLDDDIPWDDLDLWEGITRLSTPS